MFHARNAQRRRAPAPAQFHICRMLKTEGSNSEIQRSRIRSISPALSWYPGREKTARQVLMPFENGNAFRHKIGKRAERGNILFPAHFPRYLDALVCPEKGSVPPAAARAARTVGVIPPAEGDGKRPPDRWRFLRDSAATRTVFPLRVSVPPASGREKESGRFPEKRRVKT